MKLLTPFILLLALMAAGAASAATDAEGVETALSIYQYDQTRNANTLLFCDTMPFVQGIRATGFFLGFSTELEYLKVDSAGATFNVQIVTLGPTPQSYARRFTGEYGLPARIDSIAGKNGSRYALSILPVKRTKVDTSACNFIHYRPGDFAFDPTANTDLFFVKNSYGDFYWNQVKGMVEERYGLFNDLLKFSLPGKYSIYLCPCRLPSVIWDLRFGTMADPTRSSVFAIYNKSFNSADPFLVNQTALLRNLGYAPPFLTEGLANYLSIANFEMIELVKKHKQMPLDSLLSTRTYLMADPLVADYTSGSFVRYLVDQYKIDRFLTVYRKADDLNLKQTIETVYQQSIASLEQDWLHYLDTLTFRSKQFLYYSDFAEAMFDYPSSVRYAKNALARAESRQDSANALAQLVRSQFFSGNYYLAAQYQEQLNHLDTATAAGLMSLAAYQMMNGSYDSALVNLQDARRRDSTNQLTKFNLGVNALARDDTATAKTCFDALINNNRDQTAGAQARVLLAEILMKSTDPADRKLAERYCRESADMWAQIVGGHASSSMTLLWTGAAFLGQGDTGNADDYLTSALYVENRPFYLGLINLLLGKTADLRGERSVARDFYGRVIALPSADYHVREARRLLEHPYTR